MPVTPPFVLTLRMLVIALTHNEILNSTWVDSPDGPQVHVHRHVHLGFGVATKRGLLVPVITDVQDKTTRERERPSRRWCARGPRCEGATVTR